LDWDRRQSTSPSGSSRKANTPAVHAADRVEGQRQFLDAEGFDEEGGGAEGERHFLVLRVVAGGADDDGDVREVRGCLEGAKDLESVHSGHQEVEDDDARGALADDAEGVERVADDFDGPAAALQTALDDAEEIDLIVDVTDDL
jgi:hypothetical protein